MLDLEQQEDTYIINVRGDFDLGTTHDLRLEIGAAARCSSSRVIVSLTACDYCGADGLRALIDAKNLLGQRLRIVVPKNATRRVFEITELVWPLRLCASIKEALASPVASTFKL